MSLPQFLYDPNFIIIFLKIQKCARSTKSISSRALGPPRAEQGANGIVPPSPSRKSPRGTPGAFGEYLDRSVKAEEVLAWPSANSLFPKLPLKNHKLPGLVYFEVTLKPRSSGVTLCGGEGGTCPMKVGKVTVLFLLLFFFFNQKISGLDYKRNIFSYERKPAPALDPVLFLLSPLMPLNTLLFQSESRVALGVGAFWDRWGLRSCP